MGARIKSQRTAATNAEEQFVPPGSLTRNQGPAWPSGPAAVPPHTRGVTWPETGCVERWRDE